MLSCPPEPKIAPPRRAVDGPTIETHAPRVFPDRPRVGNRIAGRTLPHAIGIVTLIVLALQPTWAGHPTRDADCQFGEWLQREYGPFRTVAVTYGATRVGYGAFETMPILLDSKEPLGGQIGDAPPELLILTDRRTPDRWASTIIRAGYRRVLADIAPEHLRRWAGKHYAVWLLPRRDDRSDSVVQR